jgi:tRNA threonylcarbamoyladenosine biosynthesis protein TsaB
MSYVLHIETSGEICSVAISNDNVLIKSLESEEKQAHAAILTKLIKEVIHISNIDIKDLSAVAVSKGPGSYTGLRIGVSTAKGICYAQNVPLIAINTLESLAKGILEKERNNLEYLGFSSSDFLCIMTDARRMEVYTALFNSEGTAVSGTSAMIVDNTIHESILKTNKIFFAGSGAEKASSIIKNTNAIFLYGFKPLATNMISSANEAFINKNFENVAYFEPYYLKDFIAIKPKKMF